jgi:hypothetical protein
MRLKRPKLTHVAFGWVIFLIGAAWLLPPLDSHLSTNAETRWLILTCCIVLVLATCIATVRYFIDAWSKVRAVSNRTAYVAWISFETLVAVVVLAAAIALTWNTYAVRTAIRWFALSHDYKARVLAQPVSASGNLKHIEWDGWGWGGQDTTVYLVFDPADSLSATAASKQTGKSDSLPCEVARVARLESHWYTVQMYTNDDCWQ